MLATQTTVAPYAHTPGPYQLHLQRSESAAGQCVVSPKARMDPPRPLEPRPTHNHSLSLHDGHRSERRPDIFGFSTQSTATGRTSLPPTNTQPLPGVRDILSPRQGPPPYPPHDAWAAPREPVPPRRSPDYPHGPPNAHHYPHPPPPPPPPIYAASRPEHLTSPLPAHDRRHDLPIVESHPVVYAPQATAGASAHPQYREPYREYPENGYNRPRQQSTSSYATGSVSSPYTPNAYEDHSARGINGVYDKIAPPPFPPHGIESTKRYLGTQEFPGEGVFHVYEGGHRLPTEVDGEMVNPQWGLTKANKPRKRLAVACLDCREKKIKCEPGANSCLQCEKAKRPCRKGPTSQHHHEGSVSNDWSSNAGSPPATSASSNVDIAPQVKKDHTAKRRAAEELPNATDALKRQKSISPAGHSNGLLGVANGMVNHASAIHVAFTEHDDPLSIDRDLTLQLLHTYVGVFNTGVYAIFPRQKILTWATQGTHKSASEIMVIHAMMATATIYHDQSLSAVGEHCARVANEALNSKFGRPSLHVVHTRLLLALYSFAKGGHGPSWEYCGTAMRSISALRLNNEDGCTNTRSGNGTEDYEMSQHQLVECRRRTFWCAFMMDRLHGFNEGMLCTVDKADVYLRLPCAESTYDHAERSEAPFFDGGIVDAPSTMTPQSGTSNMAYLALVVTLWADVAKFVKRGVHRSEEGHAAAYEQFYNEIYNSLGEWKTKLPGHLQHTHENIRRSIHEGYAGDLITMHILYHSTLVKLNRCTRWSLLKEKLPRNICEAHLHANQVLGLVAEYNSAKTEPNAAHINQHHFSTPFSGYAIISAIDVVSAGGHDDLIKQTITSIQHAQTFLHALGAYWMSAAEQGKHADTRFQQLRNIIMRPYKANSGCWLGREWGMEEPLEKELAYEDDCIYGVKHGVYFEALDSLRTRTHQPRG